MTLYIQPNETVFPTTNVLTVEKIQYMTWLGFSTETTPKQIEAVGFIPVAEPAGTQPNDTTLIVDKNQNGEYVATWIDNTEYQQFLYNQTAEGSAKLKRSALLKQTDWTQNSDISLSVKTAWQPYRAALRNITTQEGFPTSIVWPTEPTEFPEVTVTPTVIQGPKGDTGDQGPKGDTGDQGPKGDTGGNVGFNISNTSSTASWVNLGTWTTTNNGTTLYMRIVAHSGYNADTSQNQVTELYFKTSNGTSNVAGFYGDGTASRNTVLGSNSNAPSTIRVVQNSLTTYTFYGYFGTWSNGSHYTYSTDSTSSWKHSGILTSAPTGTYIDISPIVSDIRVASGYVNAGSFVTLDNIKATVTTSGNRGLSVAAVSGSFQAMISGSYAMYGGANGGATAGNAIPTYTVTPSGSWFGWGFPNAGDGSTYLVNDITNQRFYRIHLMIGYSYNNNFISIERLG